MVRVFCSVIVLLMTVPALSAEPVKDPLPMAIQTGCALVSSLGDEPGLVVAVGDRGGESVQTMALAAIVGQPGCGMIKPGQAVKLPFMAAIAIGLDIGKLIARMAIQTVQASMGRPQDKSWVLELYRLPAIRRMALLAIIAQLQPVRRRSILPSLHVAINALSRCPLESQVRMTLTAGERPMHPDPPEVIEKMPIIINPGKRLQGVTHRAGQSCREIMLKTVAESAILLLLPRVFLPPRALPFGMTGSTADFRMALVEAKASFLMDRDFTPAAGWCAGGGGGGGGC